uniref:Structural protein n=1 Tax=Panagrellus redivivus TaxID=6233 RepID=A0A7E4VJI2_PANRE
MSTTANVLATPMQFSQYSFTFAADEKTFPIPAYWLQLSGLLKDYVEAGAFFDATNDIPLPQFTYAQMKLIDDVLDHIRITYIKKDVVLASDYQMLETLEFRNDSHCHAVQLATPADLRGALNLSNFLQIALAKKYFINYFANEVIALDQDVKGISILLGVEDALTPEFVTTEGLGPDSKMFKTFPNAYNAIYGNNQ